MQSNPVRRGRAASTAAVAAERGLVPLEPQHDGLVPRVRRRRHLRGEGALRGRREEQVHQQGRRAAHQEALPQRQVRLDPRGRPLGHERQGLHLLDFRLSMLAYFTTSRVVKVLFEKELSFLELRTFLYKVPHERSWQFQKKELNFIQPSERGIKQAGH